MLPVPEGWRCRWHSSAGAGAGGSADGTQHGARVPPSSKEDLCLELWNRALTPTSVCLLGAGLGNALKQRRKWSEGSLGGPQSPATADEHAGG